MTNNYLNNAHFMSSVNIDLISNDAAHSYSDTHKLWILDDKIAPPEGSHLIIGVQSFVMPYTFYNFRPGINDSFIITTDTASHTVVFPPGNYSNFEIMTYLNTLFTSIRGSLGLTTLSINLNQSTSKFFLNVQPASDIVISSVLCYKELGFESSGVGFSWTSATTCTFPYVYNLSGDTSLYIRLKNKIHNINSKRVSGIVANVPVWQTPNQFIYYNPTEIQYFKTTSNMSSIEISILDDQMNDIGTLNTSTPWRITLTCHFSYDHQHIFSQSNITNETKAIENNG